jgi:integrase
MQPDHAILAHHLSPHRVHAAQAEHARLDAFRDRLAIPNTPEAVVLYLTSLRVDGDETGKQLRRRLARLDLAAHLAGQPAPGDSEPVRLFIRGLHREAGIGPVLERSEPLYREDVRNLIDSVISPTVRQLKYAAFLSVANWAGVRYPVLADLHWRHVALRQREVDVWLPPVGGYPDSARTRVTLRARRDSRICPVALLRHLKTAQELGDGLVFAQRGGNAGHMHYRELLRPLGAVSRSKADRTRHPWTTDDALLDLIEPLLRPEVPALRDRALIAFAFLGALTNDEAVALRVVDVTRTQHGVSLDLPYRPHPRVGLPAGTDPRYCPRSAWDDWMNTRGPTHPDTPAFPRLGPFGLTITSKALTSDGIGALIAEHCLDAGYRGTYTFTSLRAGLVRSAIREGAPSHQIAAQAGLRSLRSVDRQRRRETLLTDNVASRVGL